MMFAPRSGVALSGSANVALNGSVVAYHITISGSTQDTDVTGFAAPVLESVE